MANEVIGAGNRPEVTPVEELSYEEARSELVNVVRVLELGQMGLDESLAYWERGEALAKRCEEHLSGAKRKIEQALGNAESEGNEPSPDLQETDPFESEY